MPTRRSTFYPFGPFALPGMACLLSRGFRKESSMANCRICAAETSTVKSPTYSPADMQRVVGNGFTPDETTLTRWITEKNLTREAALADWKQRVETSSSDWLLCSNCAARAAQYRRSGVEQKRLPRWARWLIGVVALVVVVLIV